MDIDVNSVANLARLNVSDDEQEWYFHQLSDVMGEIKKILDVEIDDTQMMISPSVNVNCYTTGEEKDSLTIEEVLKNAPNTKDKYISVLRSLND